MNVTDVLIKSKKTLKDLLFEQVGVYDIYCHFIGYDIEVGKVITSPIRKDNRPTFILFVPNGVDNIFFKDFAWVGGDVFKFVRLFALYHYNLHLKSLKSIVSYIDEEMGIGLFTKDKKTIIRREIDTSFYMNSRTILFKSREFTKRDKKYWKAYHIKKKTLKKYRVRSVHKLLNELKQVIYTVSFNKLSFVYIIYNKVKLYNPEETDFKWRNTCPAHYLQGLEQILKGDSKNKKLIITKSLKDVMVFDTFIGDTYDCIAPHSENNTFSKDILAWIDKKYDEVILIFDFDLAGVVGVNALRKLNRKKFKVKFVSTQRMRVNHKILTIDKDISDFAHGRKKKEVYKKLEHMGLYIP
jgi:hypothetical protein